MPLSPGEMGAIVVGLVAGFWLVSRIMERSNAPDLRSAEVGRGENRASTDEKERAETASDAKQPWWVVLEVPRIATRDEISRAHKRKISEYHPDKVAQMGAEIRALAERRSKEINAAYDEAMRGL